VTRRTVSAPSGRPGVWKTEGMDRPDPRSSSRPASPPGGVANPRRTRLGSVPVVRSGSAPAERTAE